MRRAKVSVIEVERLKEQVGKRKQSVFGKSKRSMFEFGSRSEAEGHHMTNETIVEKTKQMSQEGKGKKQMLLRKPETKGSS